MWRKIFTGVVVVGLLGFGASSAQAEQVNIAILQAFSISEASDFVLVTGAPAPVPSSPFLTQCMLGRGLCVPLRR